MTARDEGESPHEFDYEEWLKSVEGETVKITTPDVLGAQASKLMTPQTRTPYNEAYCENCDDWHLLVRFGDETVGHCPVCGRQPGMLELGTKREA